MKIDVQFSPPGSSWTELLEATRRAERSGYGAVWIFDHLLGSTFGGDGDVFECCTLLGALAAATTTITVGTLVANVANRPPPVLARAIATAQRISGGRIIAGIGAGAGPDSRWAAEHHELGIALDPSIERRHLRVVEQIGALRDVTEATVIVGANSVGLAQIAGRLADGVNVGLEHPRAAELIAAARAAHDPAVRPGAHPFEVSAWTAAPRAAAEPRARALGVDRLILTEPL